MKKILFIVLFLSSSIQANEFCPTSSESDLILKLAKELEASCDWTIKKMAKESIINKCSKAQNKDSSIRFKEISGQKEVRFTQYGNTFNSNEPNIECKHSKAYEAHLKHTISLLEREAYSSAKKVKKPSSKRPTTSTKPKKQLWSCRVPNYIRTYRIVDENEKETLEMALNIKCTPYSK